MRQTQSGIVNCYVRHQDQEARLRGQGMQTSPLSSGGRTTRSQTSDRPHTTADPLEGTSTLHACADCIWVNLMLRKAFLVCKAGPLPEQRSRKGSPCSSHGWQKVQPYPEWEAHRTTRDIGSLFCGSGGRSSGTVECKCCPQQSGPNYFHWAFMVRWLISGEGSWLLLPYAWNCSPTPHKFAIQACFPASNPSLRRISSERALALWKWSDYRPLC